MAYATTNPPKLLVTGLGTGGPAIFHYASTDAHGVVSGANYISNGQQLGMKLYDICYVIDTDGGETTLHHVSALQAAPDKGVTLA